MRITVEQNGHQMDAVLGLVKEIRGETAVFLIIGEEVAVNAAGSTINNLRKIIEENESALIPIHLKQRVSY
ncbi:hypothetical protein [Siminovitchia fordii]|uniref:Uncharacterized protein n=1 Tax=Siminovitchia fordii TaxID=254759 RepID=A0ABQ4KCX9_9BACI|nr:hypothetical protein [Siminovitchia fordii]GIN22922.1 hypothetical protein J1TS3_40560 [Siminovitchia fordii]